MGNKAIFGGGDPTEDGESLVDGETPPQAKKKLLTFTVA